MDDSPLTSLRSLNMCRDNLPILHETCHLSRCTIPVKVQSGSPSNRRGHDEAHMVNRRSSYPHTGHSM